VRKVLLRQAVARKKKYLLLYLRRVREVLALGIKRCIGSNLYSSRANILGGRQYLHATPRS
jgi:hypothetical protein